MRTKKGQAEIITTVLIVLIALAAVAIVGYFIMNQVRQGAAKGESQFQCTKLQLEITKATATTPANQIIVKRNDAEALTGAIMKVTANGATWNSSAALPNSLETKTIGMESNKTALVAGQKVEVGVVLADGTACANLATATVTAA
jgi:flagellin-like protein